MESTGRIMKLQCTRLEMLTLNSSSCDDDKIADHTIYNVSKDNKKNPDEDLSVENFTNIKDLSEACSFNHGHVPTRPRTHRVVIGVLTSSSEDDVYYFRSTQMIINERNSRIKECGDNLCSTQKIVIENNLRKSKKRSSNEEYMVYADDHQESSEKKRPKNVDKRVVTFSRKEVPSQVQNYPPSELPKSMKDYISRLNLEAPPLFVAQKVLYATDIRRGQNRLLLPEKIINTDFFDKCVTGIEKKMLKGKEYVEVSLVDNKMHEYHTLKLAKWNMKSSSNYVLKTTWNDVVKDNKLEEAVLLKDSKEETVVVMREDDDKLKSDVVVQVWCFRQDSRLWFALNIQAMTERNVMGKTKDGRYIIM